MTENQNKMIEKLKQDKAYAGMTVEVLEKNDEIHIIFSNNREKYSYIIIGDDVYYRKA